MNTDEAKGGFIMGEEAAAAPNARQQEKGHQQEQHEEQEQQHQYQQQQHRTLEKDEVMFAQPAEHSQPNGEVKDENDSDNQGSHPPRRNLRSQEEGKRTKKRMGANPDPSKFERMTEEQVKRAMNDPSMNESDKERLRDLWGSSSGSDYSFYPNMFDNGQYVYMYQQAYRMLGGYIDCDHSWSAGSHDSGDKNGQNNEDNVACSRWLMWAAYYDPNYQGGGVFEYKKEEDYGTDDAAAFDDDAAVQSKLDCHNADTEWILIGVYREELYQWYEQISKHLWAIDDYNYVVALAGLAYMTDDECFAVGAYDANGNYLYADVTPLSGANIMMGLYTDAQCLTLTEDNSVNFDQFELTSYMQLTSQDNAYDDDYTYGVSYEYWQATQEYTLTNFNGVYDYFKTCTPCIDYPTYQDGFFIGDYGTDEDDLINQCWKFYSHDSFQCNGDCIAMGSAQGTILEVKYDGVLFGSGSAQDYTEMQQEYEVEETETGVAAFMHSASVQNFAANAFIIVSGIVFVGTFLAFAVARNNAKSLEKDKKYVLMDDYYQDQGDGKSKASRRSKSSRRTSRSKSSRRTGQTSSSRERGGGSRSRSRSRRDSSHDRERRRRDRSRKSSSRRSEGEDEEDGYHVSSRYDPPELSSRKDGDKRRSSSRRSSSRPRSSSRRQRDDF